MRRNSLYTGLALALTLGITGVAGAQGTGGMSRPGDSRQEGGPRRGAEGMLLTGITLTADQQAQIKALGDQQRQQMEAQRGSMDEMRARRERGDTTGMSAFRAQMEERREHHIAALRQILSGDQRVQFEKNVADMKAKMAERSRERPNR